MILQKQLLVTIKLGRIIRICPICQKKIIQVQTVRKIINRLKTERELPVFPGVNFLAFIPRSDNAVLRDNLKKWVDETKVEMFSHKVQKPNK